MRNINDETIYMNPLSNTSQSVCITSSIIGTKTDFLEKIIIGLSLFAVIIAVIILDMENR